MNVLKLLGRTEQLFRRDVSRWEDEIAGVIRQSSFLIIGGGGSIGQAVCKEIFKRSPNVLHAVDISENNLVELVRDIRSSLGYIRGDFQTFALDAGSIEFEAFLESGSGYDYILNLSALKHVRSEKDPFTLMRMIQVNILNTEATAMKAAQTGCRKYFCVSTDKAANPVNMMGASKRIMEMFLMRASLAIPISTARFANVAFSDGSLLHGFNQRMQKRQPLSVPRDVKRYFLTPKESGELCLLSCLLGQNRDIFFPTLGEDLHLTTFPEIAIRYLEEMGYEADVCSSEVEARAKAEDGATSRKWPCYFFDSDTTGEKDFEEFFVEGEKLDMERFEGIGVIKNEAEFDHEKLEFFLQAIAGMKERGRWTKPDLINLFQEMLVNFEHKETGKNLNDKM